MKAFCGISSCVFSLLVAGAVAPAQEPAQQPAAQPAAQQPNPPPEQAPQGPVTNQPPPLPPRLPDQQMPDEGRLSVGIIGWVPRGHPLFDKGQNSIYYGFPQFDNLSRVQLKGTPKAQFGADLAVPAGKHHAIRFFYFQSSASGNFVAPNDLLLWGGQYAKGDYLATNYRFKNLKFSYEFLTWPYPIGSRKFRLKTLYQFQYITINSGFDAPLKSTANGPNTASGHESIYLPTLGIGVAYYVTPNFRLEANGSGFGFPGHSYILDGDASASYRIGKLEVRAGAKILRFRTSLHNDYFMRLMSAGLFGGVRFYLN